MRHGMGVIKGKSLLKSQGPRHGTYCTLLLERCQSVSVVKIHPLFVSMTSTSIYIWEEMYRRVKDKKVGLIFDFIMLS